MNFKTHIAKHIQAGEMRRDPTQDQLIEELTRLHGELTAYSKQAKGVRKWLWREKRQPIPRGVYVWGGVGRGKTYLVNMFFEQAPTHSKWRIHFHRFMLWVHEQNGIVANTKDPLREVARLVSAKNRLVCLDEFMVTDIADAMILYRLLKHLFDEGVVIVTTSNTEPDALYHQGIQRASFLPAIELIKQNCVVVLVDEGQDFRRQVWVCDEIYFSPLDAKAQAGLLRSHAQLTGLQEPRPRTLLVAGRNINAISATDDVVWFNFKDICQTHRSQKDYIQLCNQFNLLIISDVPELTEKEDSAARRFINLIDTTYDHGVKLLVSAAHSPDELYTGKHLERPFKRTASRLWEMSTSEYLERERKVV